MRRALLIATLVAGCNVRSPRIDLRTAALFPTLEPRSACRIQRPPYEPERGHVIMLSVEGRRTVRRIVGLAGDEIAVRGGALIVSGASVEVGVQTQRAVCMAGVSPRCTCVIAEEEVGDRRWPVQRLAGLSTERDARCAPSPNAPAVEVPPGHVYLLADNRDAALDSRHFGPVPVARIEARVLGCRP